MAHTFNSGTPALAPSRPLWRRILPKPIRFLGRPLLHAWQYTYDFSRGTWRLRKEVRLRDLRDSRDRKDLLDRATPIIQDVHGFRLVLYPYDRPNLLTLARHPADAAEFNAIPRLVRPGDIAFDVGANIGLYSMLLSRLCGATGQVWAFEPVPETYWRLRESLALNRCGNVVPVQAAACERDGTVTMNLFDAGHSEWNTLGAPLMGPNDSKVLPHAAVKVASLSLDSFCEREKIGRVNFLKVDVEGFELSVFRGAERLLRERRVDFVCFEISQPPLKSAGVSSRDVFIALEERGYFAYALDKMNATFHGPVHDTQEEWANFFASPKDLTEL